MEEKRIKKSLQHILYIIQALRKFYFIDFSLTDDYTMFDERFGQNLILNPFQKRNSIYL